DDAGAGSVLASAHADVAWRPNATPRAMRGPLSSAALDGFAAYLEAVREGASPGTVLQAFDAFRILCAHRAGPAGVDAANRVVEDALASRRLIRPLGSSGPWYVGRPVMVTRNDHVLRVYNGDVGIVLPDPRDPMRVVVAFP